MSITYSIKMSKGYTGMNSKYSKGYIARITGPDAEYGLARIFLKGVADSKEPYHKSKCSWHNEYTLTEGLHEISEGGERRYMIVYIKEGALVNTTITADRAQAIAAMLGDGVEFDAARLATKPVTA